MIAILYTMSMPSSERVVSAVVVQQFKTILVWVFGGEGGVLALHSELYSCRIHFSFQVLFYACWLGEDCLQSVCCMNMLSSAHLCHFCIFLCIVFSNF